MPDYKNRAYGNSGAIIELSKPPTPSPTLAPTEEPTIQATSPMQLEMNITNDDCVITGTKSTCDQQGVITSPDGNFTQYDLNVECQFGSLGSFVFGETGNCTCSVGILNPNGPIKSCQCTVCPLGFGPNRISIDCQEERLVGECSSMDCNYSCNGTCTSDCEPPSSDLDLLALLPHCADAGDLQELFLCLQQYSDPSCFTPQTSLSIVSCLAQQFPDITSLDATIPTDFNLDDVATCFESVSECIGDTVQGVFDNLPVCTLQKGLELTQCFLDNAEVCSSPCEALNWNSTFTALNTTNLDTSTCLSINENIMEPMCNFVSCCSPCVDKLEDLAACAVEEVFTLNETCGLQCSSSLSSPPSSVNGTRRLKGIKDIVSSRSAPVLFSKCISVDLASGSSSVWFTFVDCIIDEILSIYDMVLEDISSTGTPTISPTVTPSTIPPSLAPSTRAPVETSAPSTGTAQYTFVDLTMRLAGAKQLTEESRKAFEDATEEFYRSVFLDSSRRRLQDVSFLHFETEVTAKRELYTAEANTITYDQSVTFVSSNDLLSESETKNLLADQFSDSTKEQTYVALLQEKDPVFQSVSSAEPKSSQSGDVVDDEAIVFGLSMLFLIAIGGGLVFCCCCCCLLACIIIRRQRSDQGEKVEEDFNAKDDPDFLQPEAPIGYNDNMDKFSTGGDDFPQQGDLFDDEFGAPVRNMGNFGAADNQSGSSSGSGGDEDDESRSYSSEGDDSGESSSGSGMGFA